MMNETIFEMFDALYKTAHQQGRRIEELQNRVTELERRLRERDAEVTPERPVLRVVETPEVEGATA